MKTLKHTTQSILAVVTEKTVYLLNTKGDKIYKQFGTSTFADSQWQETDPISDDQFETLKAEFLNAEGSKKQARKEAEKQARIAAHQKRKENIVNLWNWRKGRIEAFIVATFIELNEEGSHNPEGYSSEVVFGEDAARELFDSIKESETPSWDCKSNNCYFVTEIIRFYKEPETRLDVTCIEDLQKKIQENADSLERNEYAPSIEEYDYIVTFDKWDRFHNKTYRGPIQNIEERRTGSGWIGSSHYSPQSTTADLGFDQIAVTLSELESDYYEAAIKFGIIQQVEENEE